MSEARAQDSNILELDGLTRTFGGSRWLSLGRDTTVRAVDDVSLGVRTGEAFGLVGESGSGKTTIGRLVVKLLDPSEGSLRFEGKDVAGLKGHALLEYRRRVQMVFQNPYSSLNPRRRIRDLIGDAYAIHGLREGGAADDQMAALMEKVGLRADMLDRYPHEFSSGQRQRIGLARAISVGPRLMVADEPVSALDVSVQAQVLNLLRDLQDDLGLTVIFISHDLRAVSFLCERVAVLYLGRLMELAPRAQLVTRPRHPYTQALFRSVPSLSPGRGVSRDIIRGDISDSVPSASGCVFAPRCDLRNRLGDPERCVTERPAVTPVQPDHVVACHFPDEAAADADAAVASAPEHTTGAA